MPSFKWALYSTIVKNSWCVPKHDKMNQRHAVFHVLPDAVVLHVGYNPFWIIKRKPSWSPLRSWSVFLSNQQSSILILLQFSFFLCRSFRDHPWLRRTNSHPVSYACNQYPMHYSSMLHDSLVWIFELKISKFAIVQHIALKWINVQTVYSTTYRFKMD